MFDFLKLSSSYVKNYIRMFYFIDSIYPHIAKKWKIFCLIVKESLKKSFLKKQFIFYFTVNLSRVKDVKNNIWL